MLAQREPPGGQSAGLRGEGAAQVSAPAQSEGQGFLPSSTAPLPDPWAGILGAFSGSPPKGLSFRRDVWGVIGGVPGSPEPTSHPPGTPARAGPRPGKQTPDPRGTGGAGL